MNSPTPALSHLLSALATYRLMKLVKDDYITEPLRERVIQHFGEPDTSKVSYLTTCPWCLGIYAGALVAGANTMFPNSRLVSAATAALAYSAVTGIMAEREGSDF
jgi:hypothetical protein